MTDNRVIQNPNIRPYNSVVAVDATFSGTNFNGVGSGIVIGLSHVLTAGHVAYNTNNIMQNARVLLSTDVATLQQPRIIYTTNTQGQVVSATTPSPGSINVTAQPLFPLDYPNNTGDFSTDIALLTTATPITTEQNALGIVVFLNPRDIVGKNITTAGYPATFSDGTGLQDSRTDDNTGRTLYSASGTVHNTTGTNTRIGYSQEVFTQGGQSGSGVWYSDDLFGETVELVAAIHTRGFNDVRQSINGSQSGVLISKEIYDKIVAQMEADSGVGNAAQLPENVIIGSDSSIFSFLPFVSNGDDLIIGSYRRERIIGQGGDNRLFGGGGDDRLEGGEGIDQALFAESYALNSQSVTGEYTITIIDPDNRIFQVEHTGGSQNEGKNKLTDIEFAVFNYDPNTDNQSDLFFVSLQVDPDDNTKLKDGPKITPEKEILDEEGQKIGTITVESPAWMFDGDVNYTLTIGSDQGNLFNFAYIVDVSGSMFGSRLTDTKNAYIALTNSLIDQGVADNSQFAVIPFSSSASLIGPLNAEQAKTTINGLNASGLTNFEAGLNQSINFFSNNQSPGVQNIAYFLSDGAVNVGARGAALAAIANNLQQLAEVRAFGIGAAQLNELNLIDSGTAGRLTSSTDLITEFSAGIVNRETIERIDVTLEGNVIDTILPNQLDETTLGLTFKGTLEGLEVTRTAENNISFDVFFNNDTPTTSVKYRITTGQKEVREQTADGTREVITFSVNQDDFIGSLENQTVIGNDLDNVIISEGGENLLFGNGGNDRFILKGGINFVNGGEGINTVEIPMTRAAAGGVTKTGNVVRIGTNNTLVNVDFIEFSDVRLAVDTLAVTPIISLAETVLLVEEGDVGSNFGVFTVNLSSITTEDVVINFSTRSDTALAGIDFVNIASQLIIPSGESSGEIQVEVLGDTVVEGDETFFLDLTAVSGGTFIDGALTKVGGVVILDDDAAISVPITGLPTVLEGSTLSLTLERFGDLRNSDTIEVEIVPAGDNPAQASNFGDGFFSRQVTFEPGQSTKTIDIVTTEVNSDKTFGVQLTNIAGSASVPSGEILFTILNVNDTQEPGVNIIQGTPGRDVLIGTDGSDIIIGGEGRDILTGGGGKNTFVYQNIRDAGDIITDFTVGMDLIDMVELLAKTSFSGTNAIADGFLGFVSQGSDTIVTFDPNGTGFQRGIPLVLVQGVDETSLNNASNFVF